MWGKGRKYFDCIDLHCGGEPARVMFSTNCPPIPGKSMSEKRESMIENFDHIRRVLLQVYLYIFLCQYIPIILILTVGNY